MNVCAVIITAFQAENYILETLNSLKNQRLPKDWNIKYYIGVDGCKSTALVLSNNKIPYYYTEENVGTYILTNSLLEKANKDNSNVFVRFDSDDIPCNNFLYNGIKHTINSGFTRPYQIVCDENMQPITNEVRLAHGSMFITAEALEQLGGYYHYRAGCDTNFYRRAERLKFVSPITDTDKRPVYFYRQHNNSLMKHSSMGKGSAYRKESWAEMKKEFFKGVNKIDPVTTKLLYID